MRPSPAEPTWAWARSERPAHPPGGCIPKRSSVDRGAVLIALAIGAASFAVAALLVRPPDVPPVADPPPVAEAPPVADPPPETPPPQPPPPGSPDPGIGQGTASVRVQLTDRAGALVTCGGTLWRVLSEGRRAMGEGSTQSCSGGVLRWEGLPPGDWRLMASGPGLALYDRSFAVGEGEVLDLGAVALDPGGRVHGVVTQEGAPVGSARVRSSDGQVTRTDALGRFRLEGVPVGPVRLDVLAGRFSGQAQAEVVVEQSVAVDVALRPLAPRGMVGLRVDSREGAVVVATVVEGSPAAGQVLPEDQLLAVDGVAVGGDLDRARALMAGAPGEPVTLQVLRGEQTLELVLVRAAAGEL